MTRLKIQMIKFLAFLLIFLATQSTVCDGNFRINRNVPAQTLIGKSVNETTHTPSNGQKKEHQNAVLLDDTMTMTNPENKTLNNITSKSSVDNNTTEPRKEHEGIGHSATLNTGALKRGIYVFVGLSVLVMAYFMFRNLRLNKTRAQMVRKYGILANRQDVEMRPLPLDEEDDEDTTVFDASNILSNNIRHQNL